MQNRLAMFTRASITRISNDTPKKCPFYRREVIPESCEIVPVSEIYGAPMGYDRNAKLVILLSVSTKSNKLDVSDELDMLATVDTSNLNKWKIVMKPVTRIDHNGIPENASIFKSILVDGKISLVFRRLLEERVVEYDGTLRYNRIKSSSNNCTNLMLFDLEL